MINYKCGCCEDAISPCILSVEADSSGDPIYCPYSILAKAKWRKQRERRDSKKEKLIVPKGTKASINLRT